MGAKTLHVVGDAPRCNEELRSWLETYIAGHPHHTTTELSRPGFIGYSKPALDAYLKGVYGVPKENGGQGGNIERIEHAIRQYREKVEGTVRHGYASTFVETKAWRQMQRACSTAINEDAIVVVYAPPGRGKTRSLGEFGIRNLGSVAPISIKCSPNIHTGYFLQKILREMNQPTHGSIAAMEDEIIRLLKKNPRPLFFDQANYLPIKGLGSVCYIWEEARIPVVLAGTTVLYDTFRTAGTEDERSQLASRVAMHYLLGELTPAEATAIIKRGLGKDATDANVAAIIRVTQCVHRHVDNIIPRIIELKETDTVKEKLAAGEITMEDVIVTAGRRLMIA